MLRLLKKRFYVPPSMPRSHKVMQLASSPLSCTKIRALIVVMMALRLSVSVKYSFELYDYGSIALYLKAQRDLYGS